VPVDDLAGLAYRARGDEGRGYRESMPPERVTVLTWTAAVFWRPAVLAAGVVEKEFGRGGRGGAAVGE